MSDSANIDPVNESTEDGAQSYKVIWLASELSSEFFSSSLGTGGTGKPVHCTEC